MRTGDILLFRDNRLLSRIIGGISGGKYSHTAMCVYSHDPDIYTSINIIESTWKGIKVNKLESKDYNNVDVYRYCNSTIDLEFKLSSDAIKYVNKEYDYKLLFTIMFYKWFGIAPKDAKEKFICSEFIDMIYKKNGIDIIPSVVTDNVTPNELGKILNSNAQFKKVGIYDY
jgi:hypothetical protein